MAVTPVRASTKGRAASNSAATSFGTRPIAGDGVIVYAWGSGTNTLTGLACSDNQGVGNAYTLLASAAMTSGAPGSCAIWCCPAIGATSGTFTVTATLNAGTSDCITGAEEFSALVLPVDKTASTTAGGSTTTPTSGTTAATTQADEVAAAVFVLAGGTNPTTITSPTGYSVVVTEPDNSTWQVGEGDYKVLSATGTQSATWTVSPGNVYGAAIAAVKGAVGASDPYPLGYGPEQQASPTVWRL